MLKAFYVLRCFYGESLQSGQDIKTDLKDQLGTPVLVVLFLFLAPPLQADAASAAPDSVSAEVSGPKLDQAIKEVISRREYSWRLPRPAQTDPAREGPMRRFLKSAADTIKEAGRTVRSWAERLVGWLRGRKGMPSDQGGSPEGWTSMLHLLMLLLALLLVGVLLFLLFRLWHRRARHSEVRAEAIAAMPDLTDENVAADQLPEDGWRRLASELMERGELRLALRAYYLASLAHLAQRHLLSIAKFKSNRDYEQELERRSHALPQLLGLFRDNVSTFDRTWYGLHDVNPQLVAQFAQNVEHICAG